MEKNKNNRLTEIIMIAVVIICLGLIVLELLTNIQSKLSQFYVIPVNNSIN